MQLNIGIVGCGVAGLSAALMLARDGHGVTVLERSDHVGPAGAGILLQPSGQAALQQMGLLADVVALAARIERQSRGWTLGAMRDIGLPLLPKLPILRRQMVATMSGMKRSALGGKLNFLLARLS